MLSTSIPELQSEDDILYIRDALALDLSDEEAAARFVNLINNSLASMSTQVMFTAHLIAHSGPLAGIVS